MAALECLDLLYAARVVVQRQPAAGKVRALGVSGRPEWMRMGVSVRMHGFVWRSRMEQLTVGASR